jgi:tRNA (cytidine/uridine-2'-O-)-methyltransferase
MRKKSYLEIDFQDGDWLVLESKGLSEEFLAKFENHLKKMSNLIRSFNIANSVAFVIGEAKRQIMLKVRQ